MTSATLRRSAATAINADALVIGVQSSGDTLSPAPGAADVAAAFGSDFMTTLKELGASSKPGEVCKIPGAGATKSGLVLVVGLGSAGDVDLETLRRASGAAARALTGKKTVAMALPAESDEQIGAVATGALLGSYGYDRYLTKKHEAIGEIVVLTDLARSKNAKAVLTEATVVTDAVNFARDLVNTPPNDLYPESFAGELKTAGKQSKVKVSVLDEKSLADGAYGGILSVGQGSARPPRLVTLSYRPSRPVAHLAFVGKGITFDSGGLSIKPSNSMVTMKCDMSGAAAVAAATFAIADLRLPVQVTAYACLAENMPSGQAARPGDVITMHGGKTVEVLNTDAEGRLVLADGITTANAVKPDLIVDVATLTGACVVALGTKVSGVFANDEALHEEVVGLASGVGEQMWPLPIPEEMKDKVHTTKIADLSQHNPEPYGGAMYAAAFLREFVGEGVPWVHLDIAGPAFNDAAPFGYTPKGGTGTAVRTLVALAQSRTRR